MADLTLGATAPLDASDDSRLFFTQDIDQTQSRALDNVPANFLSMLTLSWAVEYAQSGRVDDTLALGIRIVNGATILAAADAGGTFQTVNANVTNTTEQTTGPTAFGFVNTSASQATWNGASVELQQDITRSMSADACFLFVDFVQFTGTYAGSIQIAHTSDLRVGIFIDHTTDLTISEFSRPADTNAGVSFGVANKMAVDDNGTVWMVGVATGSTPQTIRLWEGPASGPGFWQLHEFNHGAGAIRDVAMAIVNGVVHIVYINHVGSSITQYHIEWPIGGNSFTNNGAFGTAESHSDPTASQDDEIDIVSTSDDELVVLSKLSTYTSFGGSTAFRFRARLYRSVTQSFSGGGTLYREWWGPNIFDRPATPDPALYAVNTDAIVQPSNAVFSSSAVLSDYHPRAQHGHSMPHLPLGEGNGSYLIRPILHQGVWYWGYQNSSADILGYVAATAEENPLYDRGAIIGDPPATSGAFTLFIDHRGHLGGWWYRSADNTAIVFISDGLGRWYPHQYSTESGGNQFQWYFQPGKTVERAFSAWARTVSGSWIWIGTTIPTWYTAHTTDIVITEGDAQVYHRTDMRIVSGSWGLITQSTVRNPILNTFIYNSNHYYVLGTPGLTDVATLNWTTIEVFESSTIQNRGERIALWNTRDIAGSSGLEWLDSWAMVHDSSGVIHFLLMIWDNSRWEAHHSEYDIDLDTWTHHGSFFNSAVMHQDVLTAAFLEQRANGDLIAFFKVSTPGTGWHYAINTGSGFGAATSLGHNSGFASGGVATDSNETHMMVYESSSMYHWRLSPTNVISARQGPNASFPTNPIEAFPSGSPLVHNNTMYIPGLTGVGQDVVVYHAATGSDAPTWTATTVTTRDIDRICGLVLGVGGVPTLFYVERSTWVVWKAVLEAGTWVETSTGQIFPVEPGDIISGELGGPTISIFAYPAVDANGHAFIWWRRVYQADGEPVEDRWYPYRVNLNRLALHTTDIVTVEGAHVVVHTTDLIVKLVADISHTTDLVLSDDVEAAVGHSTDIRKVSRAVVVHTIDVFVVRVLTHSTDIVIATQAHELSATITIGLGLNATLSQGDKPAATGLGVPRHHEQAPRIYNPDHRVVKR